MGHPAAGRSLTLGLQQGGGSPWGEGSVLEGILALGMWDGAEGGAGGWQAGV